MVHVEVIQGDCLEWIATQPSNHFHAVVTDPPFGLEFEPRQLDKRRLGVGGSWRVPSPGRKAVPRFTELSSEDLRSVETFFARLSKELLRVLRPGAHAFVASNTLMSSWMFRPFIESGFERRGEIVRLVQTLRGGDRPKGAEREFPLVCASPRSAWEPWGLFRKPLSEKTLAQNLRRWQVGGLRRCSFARPFTDVIPSGFPTKRERQISSHPALKPQAWLRPLVHAALPCSAGCVLDPFAGSGSTLAAALALGFDAIGVERDDAFYADCLQAVHALANIDIDLGELLGID